MFAVTKLSKVSHCNEAYKWCTPLNRREMNAPKPIMRKRSPQNCLPIKFLRAVNLREYKTQMARNKNLGLLACSMADLEHMRAEPVGLFAIEADG